MNSLKELWKMVSYAFTQDSEMGKINRSMAKIVYPCIVLMLITNNIMKYFISDIMVSIICVVFIIPVFVAMISHQNKVKHMMDRDEVIKTIKQDIQGGKNG